MTLTSLGCGPVYYSPWTEFARAGQFDLLMIAKLLQGNSCGSADVRAYRTVQ